MAKKKKPGRKRKRQEDEMSDEELARSLEGWLEVSCLSETDLRSDLEVPILHSRLSLGRSKHDGSFPC